MKKFLLTAALICISAHVFADENITKPVWEEVCPEEFLHIKELTSKEYSQKFYKGIFPPAKKTLENYNKTAKYWADRKKHFDDYVNTCLTLPGGKQGVCFMKVRESEFEENRKMHYTVQDKINQEAELDERVKNNQMMMINNEMRKYNPMY